MLSLTMVLEIRRLLDEGELSQRAIAEKLNVSRGVVGAMASGRRGLFGRDESAPARHAINPGALPVRCPDCGGLVYLPCVLCAARAYRYGSQKLGRFAAYAPRRRPRRVPRRVA